MLITITMVPEPSLIDHFEQRHENYTPRIPIQMHPWIPYPQMNSGYPNLSLMIVFLNIRYTSGSPQFVLDFWCLWTSIFEAIRSIRIPKHSRACSNYSTFDVGVRVCPDILSYHGITWGLCRSWPRWPRETSVLPHDFMQPTVSTDSILYGMVCIL